jgi:hypothetical protein
MGKAERATAELKDKAEKLQSAQEHAAKPRASARDKADLKMMEQDFQAQRLKGDRLAKQPGKARNRPMTPADKKEKKLDDALVDSFPGSDPVSFTASVPGKKGDPKS